MKAQEYLRDLEPRVTEVLRDNGLDHVGPLQVLPGGHSGLTYATATESGRLVVKAVPPGQKPIGRHDMVRQARIMQALGPTPVPVPDIVVVDDRHPAWFAMEFVEGESLEPVLDDPAVEPAVATARMRRAAEVLTLLHAVPLQDLPVDGVPLSPTNELARWARTMATVPPELVQGAEKLQDALERTTPAAVHPTLVHGDYRLGNLIARTTEPVALIDWEIWSIGDPRVELGWFLVFADGANFPGAGRDVPDLPPRTSWCSGTSVTAGICPVSTGSRPWDGSRWPPSWGTTCGGTARGVITTRSRSACPTRSST
ncbi:phosphotransferase family protein [Allosalinactinospora lopnorensis]|uniref:phosphotransferase family protein n=1 Tax=Allosalinactinospora lopnorensis TaxID=1352348 RepID=UPI000ADC478D|nr:phosphotransferase family protein [Allosalinactinospora lopnorensis]